MRACGVDASITATPWRAGPLSEDCSAARKLHGDEHSPVQAPAAGAGACARIAGWHAAARCARHGTRAPEPEAMAQTLPRRCVKRVDTGRWCCSAAVVLCVYRLRYVSAHGCAGSSDACGKRCASSPRIGGLASQSAC